MEMSNVVREIHIAPALRTLISGALLLLIAVLTDPTSTHPIILIAAFVLVFSTLYFGLRAITRVIPGIRGRPDRRQRLVAASSSGVLTLVLLLQSIGQLTVRDVATVSIFCILLYFYVSKFGNSHAG
jgi:hypothetical membrane protein